MIKEWIKKYQKTSMLTSILMMILSIFLMIKPLESLKFVVMIFAAITLIDGIIHIISYLKIPKDSRMMSFSFLEGMLETLAAILIFFNWQTLLSFLPIMIGVWIIIKSLLRVQIALNLRDFPHSNWQFMLGLAILLIVLGILIILDPFGTILTLTTLTGIILFLSEIINLIEDIYILIKIK